MSRRVNVRDWRHRPPRRRSEPHRYLQRNVPRRWRHRLEPEVARRLRPHGVVGAWLRARRLLWSRWLWVGLLAGALLFEAWGFAAVFGVLAFVSHLIAAPARTPRFGLDRPLPVASKLFLASISGMTAATFQTGNRLEILNNGDAFYPAMLDAIARAEASITMEAYIYWDGNVGRQFAEALAEQSRRGVAVKLLLDAVGSATVGEDILRLLGAGGCHVAWFHPIHWYTIGRFNNRTHRKSLIVDGRVAFTGGAGIADIWLGDASNVHQWRDLMIRLEGPGAVPLQTGFALNWLETTGELLSGERYYPSPAKAGRARAMTILSSPTTGASAVRLMYYFSLACAERTILIANPYFVPDPVAIETLVTARRRGVDVRVIVSGTHNDNWLARQNSVRLYGVLLAAGVEIFEYNRTMLHHKTMVVDGTWATVGTTNFDNRSFAHNEESNVCFADPGAVAALEQSLLADLARAERVDFAAWRRRGILPRAAELVASLLEDQV